MSLLSFLKRNKLVKPVEIKSCGCISKPAEPISCIARAIIEDLKDEKLWEVDNNDFWGYNVNIKNKNRNYFLYISITYNISLVGFKSIIFNKTEQDLIYTTFIEMRNLKDKRKEENLIKKENIKLKKIFPECFNK